MQYDIHFSLENHFLTALASQLSTGSHSIRPIGSRRNHPTSYFYHPGPCRLPCPALVTFSCLGTRCTLIRFSSIGSSESTTLRTRLPLSTYRIILQVHSALSKPTMSTKRVLPQIISGLGRYSSCEVADVLIKLKYPHGGYLPDINIQSFAGDSSQLKLCGEAFTVEMVSASDIQSPKPQEHYVDAAQKDSVIVISSPPNLKNAVWGGLMTARAKVKQVKGVVIDGRCRDLAEHKEAAFPVFARGHSVLGQSTFTRPARLQVPVTIHPTRDFWDKSETMPSFSPVQVHPYDVILADQDGVVVISKEVAETVLELCAQHAEVDRKCLEALKAGEKIEDTFKKFRLK
ncbi:hypothetical protein O181_038716 [Austropuccinia psidii MF-1]|uniref:RraA-like protein n=1 Tax=Austropuccinia psidii MF-1 TaxID=1389203 RepID=A0A9Q3HBW0_9BASI|nr:hypothetical protein [Austropuccinia psidii MF-1]